MSGVEQGPDHVKARLTRRPERMRRRFDLINKRRLKDLAAPLDSPGLDLAEVPIIGPIVLAVFALLVVVVLGVLLGGFLIAFIELTLLVVVALAGSLWAWLRGHPKVAVIELGDQRWIRREGPSATIAEDERAVSQGTAPSALGYHKADRTP